MARDSTAVKKLCGVFVSSSLEATQKSGGMKSMGLEVPIIQLKVLE